MDEREAQELCGKLAAEHPDRDTHRWIARADDAGEWSVVKIGLPPIIDLKLSTTSGSESEGQPAGEDPGPPLFRNIPPFGA